MPTPSYLRAKRLLDILCSGMGLVLLSPLLLSLIMVHLVVNRGAVFFKQERIGRHGQPFMIYKFRTLPTDNEANGARLTPHEAQHNLPPLSRWMRRHHLDELPQLWNVLVGDMSLVGYRPERAIFIGQIRQRDVRYTQLYAMRPGLTSKASVLNGYTDTIEKMLIRLEMDLAYLDDCSLRTDLSILWLTSKNLFFPQSLR